MNWSISEHFHNNNCFFKKEKGFCMEWLIISCKEGFIFTLLIVLILHIFFFRQGLPIFSSCRVIVSCPTKSQRWLSKENCHYVIQCNFVPGMINIFPQQLLPALIYVWFNIFIFVVRTLSSIYDGGPSRK